MPIVGGLVAEELAAAGVTAHLAEPAGTAFARGRKRHTKTDKTDCRHLGTLLAGGRLPECWIPPSHILECRALLETYHDLRAEHTAQAQLRGLVPPGRPAPGRGDTSQRAGPGRAAGGRGRPPVTGWAAAGRHRPGHDRHAGNPAARAGDDECYELWSDGYRGTVAPGRALRLVVSGWRIHRLISS